MKSTSDNETNTGLETIAKSSIFVFVVIILSNLFNYIYRVVIARQFGPEIYGIFSLSLIVLGIFVSISSFGLIDGLLRFIPFYRGKKQINKIRYLIKRTVIILSISGIVSAVALFLLAPFISINLFHTGKMTIFLQILSICIPLTLLSSAFLIVIRSYEKIGWYSFISNVVQSLTKLLMLGVLIFIGIGENSITFSYTFGLLSMLVISYIVCKYSLPFLFGSHSLNKKQKSKILKEIFIYSLPIIFLSLINNIYYWTDSLLIGFFMNPTAVGFYNVATPIVGIIAIIPSMFEQLFFPLITRYFSQKKNLALTEITKQVGKWVFILIVPIFVIIFLFPGAIINFFFGQEYLSAQSALKILAVGGFFSSFTLLFSDLIYIVGKSKIVLINTILTLMLNIILNVILIKKYGIDGAAWATTIVWVILCVFLLFEIKHYLHFVPLRKKMITILLVSIIPLLLLLALRALVEINTLSMIFLGIFFFLIYILTILLSKGLDKNDLFILKKIFNFSRKKPIEEIKEI